MYRNSLINEYIYPEFFVRHMHNASNAIYII